MKHMQRSTVRVGVYGHRRQPHLAARANDPQGNFAAIRNQDLLYRPSQAAILPQAIYTFACTGKREGPPISGRPFSLLQSQRLLHGYAATGLLFLLALIFLTSTHRP